MDNVNKTNAIGTVACLANAVDLIVDVYRAVSGEEISTLVGETDANTAGFYEVVAVKLKAELSARI